MGEIAALLFTDAVESTLTTQRLGDERALALWTEHDRRAHDLLRRHRGREIDRADGFEPTSKTWYLQFCGFDACDIRSSASG